MYIDPSEIVYFQWKFIKITATIVFSWVTIALLGGFSYFFTKNLKTEGEIGRTQTVLEGVILGIKEQIETVIGENGEKYLPFIGTMFLYIVTANLLDLVPGFIAHTGSLNSTIALSLCVLFSVPYFGIESQGLRSYLKEYTQPNYFMLPFHILGEISRTISLAIRLYGNIMSGSVISLVLIGVIPLLFPIIMDFLGIITGIIQAYIFAILATVYIASGLEKREE